MSSPYRKPRQEPYQFARARAEQSLREITTGGALARLAERRIGRHEARQGRNLEAPGNRKAPRLDQLAGIGADDGSTEDVAALIGDRFHQTVIHALGAGAVVVGKRPAQDLCAVTVLLPRRLLAEANLRQLG